MQIFDLIKFRFLRQGEVVARQLPGGRPSSRNRADLQDTNASAYRYNANAILLADESQLKHYEKSNEVEENQKNPLNSDSFLAVESHR